MYVELESQVDITGIWWDLMAVFVSASLISASVSKRLRRRLILSCAHRSRSIRRRRRRSRSRSISKITLAQRYRTHTHTHSNRRIAQKKTFVQWIYIPKFEIGTLHETKRHVSNIQLNWPLDTQRGKRAICIQQMAANDSQRHCNFGRREPHRCLKYSLLSVGKTADTLFQCQ